MPYVAGCPTCAWRSENNSEDSVGVVLSGAVHDIKTERESRRIRERSAIIQIRRLAQWDNRLTWSTVVAVRTHGRIRISDSRTERRVMIQIWLVAGKALSSLGRLS